MAPGGTGTGVLSTGPVTFAAGTAFNVQINGAAAGGGYDQLNVEGG